MKLPLTRAMVTAALNGELEKSEFVLDPIFNVMVPKTCPGVPSEVLSPREFWADKAAYEETARKLAGMFQKNFHQVQEHEPGDHRRGPQGLTWFSPPCFGRPVFEPGGFSIPKTERRPPHGSGAGEKRRRAPRDGCRAGAACYNGNETKTAAKAGIRREICARGSSITERTRSSASTSNRSGRMGAPGVPQARTVLYRYQSQGRVSRYHGVNANGNVGTLLYVHECEAGKYRRSPACYRIDLLAERFLRGGMSFDGAVKTAAEKKIVNVPDCSMQLFCRTRRAGC
jgi:hypothetical protein